MAVMKAKLSKPKTSSVVKAKQPKRIKPPEPSKAVKPKATPRSTDSRRGALGATSPY